MNAALSDAIKEAFAICPISKVIYDTLEIAQAGVQDTIYMVRARKGIEAKDENGILRSFEPVGFEFTLPPSNEDGFQSLNVSIDNVGRRIADFVEVAKSDRVTVIVKYRPYLSDDLEQPHMIPPVTLFLKDLQINDFIVTGRATFMDIVNKKFPALLYIRSRFPALG